MIVLLAIYSGDLQWILKDNLISYDNDEVYERNETENALFISAQIRRPESVYVLMLVFYKSLTTMTALCKGVRELPY